MEAEAVVSGDPAVSEEPGAADTPGRMLIFNTLVDKFLEGLVEAGSYPRFARCYMKFYKVQPALTRGIYDQFVAQLHSSIQAEIEEIKEEGNLEALLTSLDKMEAGAEPGHVMWRPSGLPEADLRSHLVPFLLQQRDFLRKMVRERQEENTRLGQSVLSGRSNIEHLQREIQRRQQAWQKLSQSQRELILSLKQLEPASSAAPP